MEKALKNLRENRVIACIFRCLALLISSYGLIVMLVITSSPLQIFYFTIQTNIFAIVLFIALVPGTAMQIRKSGTRGSVFSVDPVLQVGVAFFITITMVIYWTLLSGQSFDMSKLPFPPILFQSSNYILHTVTPVFVILDWILFLPHGKLTKKAGLLYLLYPLLYSVLIFIRAEVGPPFYADMRYPYPFLNVDSLGWPAVISIVLMMCIGFLLLGQLYVFIDKRIAQKT
jgi:hypothetical protein